ncbi:PPK2 family polyphosphate kinase [Streptomyces sp. NPDC058548]|uniref:PPK2 family polyphosphate kinase n=1 Tax=Streptomyces sp. NPDC058548 TaxID=3346545 RepID=UPI00366008D5
MAKKDGKKDGKKDSRKDGGKDSRKDGSKDAGKKHKGTSGPTPLRELLRVPEGERIDLTTYDASATPAGPADKAAGLAATAALAPRLADLQERLYAASTAGDRRRVLLVLQGMDTSGKGGTVKHVIGLFNPSGCRIHAFKAPTPEEQNHPFLWRITKALPRPGEIGIFDRSHYEDVLIARVRELVPRSQLGRRYGQINRFEKSLADDGVTVVKVFLHISYEEQRSRLLERLDNPEKHWKFNVGDIEERGMWPAYREAYEIALERCATDEAPWYLVPADRKWYRNWAISTLLLEHLEALDPKYPPGDFDVAESRRRLLAT